MNLYEQIKQMSLDEMARFFSDLTHSGAYDSFGFRPKKECDSNCKKCVKEWLEREATTYND